VRPNSHAGGKPVKNAKTGPGEAVLTRERVQALALLAGTAIVAWLSWLIVESLVAPIACALALAVLVQPAHEWLLKRVPNATLAAALVTLLVSVVLIAPAGLAGQQVAQQAVITAKKAEETLGGGRWREYIKRNPRIAAFADWVDGTGTLDQQLARLGEQLPKVVQKVIGGAVLLATGVAIALLLLFFFLRDRDRMLSALRGLLPLSPPEATLLIKRVHDMLYAIVFGTLSVALIQGALGALMFWWLDLPAPLLWGAAMAALAIIPVVGAAAIWVPAALWLFTQGDAGKAAILVAWGVVVIGLIDNLLQPLIVKGRMDVHFVPVFVSLLGGIAAFGATGLVIGPVILAIAIALLQIWRQRAGTTTPANSL
jgi:predicted PurR-regulated permease PerM